MEVKIKRIHGEGLGMVFPQEFLDETGLDEHDELNLRPFDSGFVATIDFVDVEE